MRTARLVEERSRTLDIQSKCQFRRRCLGKGGGGVGSLPAGRCGVVVLVVLTVLVQLVACSEHIIDRHRRRHLGSHVGKRNYPRYSHVSGELDVRRGSVDINKSDFSLSGYDTEDLDHSWKSETVDQDFTTEDERDYVYKHSSDNYSVGSLVEAGHRTLSTDTDHRQLIGHHTQHSIKPTKVCRRPALDSELIDVGQTAVSYHDYFRLYLKNGTLLSNAEIDEILLCRKMYTSISNDTVNCFNRVTCRHIAQKHKQSKGSDHQRFGSIRNKRKVQQSQNHDTPYIDKDLLEAAKKFAAEQDSAVISLSSECRHNIQPIPVFVHLNNKSAMEYFEPKIIRLHRCLEEMSCCNDTEDLVVTKQVTLDKAVFFFTTQHANGVGQSMGRPEMKTFINHTECKCIPIKEISSLEKSSIQSLDESTTLLPNVHDKRCPVPFTMSVKSKKRVVCKCSGGNRKCNRIAGHKEKSEKLVVPEIECIRRKKCYKPQCNKGYRFILNEGNCVWPTIPTENTNTRKSKS